MKVSTQKNIGRNLRALRTHNNPSQSDMAAAAGLTRSTYVQYELGNRTPDAEALYDVASYFRLDMKKFFEPDIEKFIGEISFALDCSEGEDQLVDNYNALTPFYKGVLLEKSAQLVAWDRKRLINLEALQHTRDAERNVPVRADLP